MTAPPSGPSGAAEWGVVTTDERRPARNQVIPFGLLAAFAAGAIPFFVTVIAWPEIIVPAYFMTRGGILYKTIFFPHTPLLISALAAMGGLIGFSGALFRSVVSIGMAATAVMVVLGLERRRGFPIAAAVGVLLSVLWLSYMNGLAVWPDPLLAPVVLGAALLLERFEKSDSERCLRAAGLLLGLAILVKQTSAWVALASLLWMLWRRKSRRRTLILGLMIALPYAAFAVLWAVAYRTSSHVVWTFLLPVFSPMGQQIRWIASPRDLQESLAPFLALPALFLLNRALNVRDGLPVALMAVGTFGMAWPRAGVMHLSASTGLVSVLAARALLAAFEFFGRGRRERFPIGRIVAAAGGGSLLVIGLCVGVLGGGSRLVESWDGKVFYWDDRITTDLLKQVNAHLTPDRRIYLFHVWLDNVYVRAKALTPDGLYVNSSFWYCLNHDRVDERVTSGLSGFSGWILFHDVHPSEVELRKTALYQFLNLHTVLRESLGDALSWRVVDPSAQ
jgi:Dolichyl-phosphate-mannose-protein mannosyltransferase